MAKQGAIGALVALIIGINFAILQASTYGSTVVVGKAANNTSVFFFLSKFFKI